MTNPTQPTLPEPDINELRRRASQQDAEAWRILCAMNGTTPPGFARLPETQLSLPLGQ